MPRLRAPGVRRAVRDRALLDAKVFVAIEVGLGVALGLFWVGNQTTS
jgi:hypothetical protein